jgi:hypothetical protein
MHVSEGDSLRLRCTQPSGVSFMPPQNHRATTLWGSQGQYRHRATGGSPPGPHAGPGRSQGSRRPVAGPDRRVPRRQGRATRRRPSKAARHHRRRHLADPVPPRRQMIQFEASRRHRPRGWSWSTWQESRERPEETGESLPIQDSSQPPYGCQVLFPDQRRTVMNIQRIRRMGAALLAATVAVLVDRTRATRRQAIGGAAAARLANRAPRPT